MASKLNYSLLLRNRKLDAITTEVGNAGILRIYDNGAAQPAGPGTAVPGGSVLLAEYTLGSPFASASSGGVLSPTIPADVNASASGTPAWYRVFKSDGTTGVIDGSAGSSGCDMNVTGTITSGAPVHINSWTYTDGNSGH